ncbi:esterase/lipase family protein [Oleisolibacter albus]|uniref:esterase/lipase family protein n=1 Tax=Oleisolibacter albus TaxID=2171757 RepID=UPI0012D80C14|nr:hypothetical protein [Oleisolibacter albus]
MTPAEPIPGPLRRRARLPLVWGRRHSWTDLAVLAGWRVQRHAIDQSCRLVGPDGVVRRIGTAEACLAGLPRLPRPRKHMAVLLHGLSCRPESMHEYERAMAAAGLSAVSICYASTLGDMPQHLEAIDQALTFLADHGVRSLSFVGYSLGGLLVRMLTGRDRTPWSDRMAVRRAVLVATPNRGASLAEFFARTPFLGLMGPCAAQIRPEPVRTLPPPGCGFATIAAGRGDARCGWNPLLDGDNDFVVRTREAQLDGAGAHLFIRSTHTGILRHAGAADAAAAYVRTGRLG